MDSLIYILLCVTGLIYLLSAVGGVLYIIRPDTFKLKRIWIFIFTGFVLHTILLVTLSVKMGQVPINSVSNSLVVFLWCTILVFIFFERLYSLPSLGAFLTPLMFLFLIGTMYFIFAKSPLHEEKPSDDAFYDFWVIAHLVPIFLGYASFMISCAASVMFLVQERQLRLKLFGSLLKRLPSLETLDHIAHKSTTFGFPLLTLGLLLGVAWIKVSPKFQGDWLDWKVASGIATWLAYAIILHMRVAAMLRGRKIAYLTIAGFLFVMFTFLGTFLLGFEHNFSMSAATNIGLEKVI